MNEPRVWKWLGPAFAMVALIPVAASLNMIAERNQWTWMLWCNFTVVGTMMFLGIQAWAAFKAYFRRLEVEDLLDRQNALATTAEVRQFEYARMMHPETVRLLLLQKKTIWRVKQAKPGDMADWVLDEDPSVRVAFVEYVLEHSTDMKMMPMNLLSEGAYSFDASRLVTDYDQYRALHRVLINHGMATDAFGNQPGQWIPPWKPELVAAQWGIVMEEEDFPLPPAPLPPPTPPPTPPQIQKQNLERGVKEEISDEDMSKIHALNKARETMSVKDYMAFCKAQQ